ncbi:hypothetical protein H0H92_006410, partial [Tricholoma furcatifolium]
MPENGAPHMDMGAHPPGPPAYSFYRSPYDQPPPPQIHAPVVPPALHDTAHPYMGAHSQAGPPAYSLYQTPYDRPPSPQVHAPFIPPMLHDTTHPYTGPHPPGPPAHSFYQTPYARPPSPEIHTPVIPPMHEEEHNSNAPRPSMPFKPIIPGVNVPIYSRPPLSNAMIRQQQQLNPPNQHPVLNEAHSNSQVGRPQSPYDHAPTPHPYAPHMNFQDPHTRGGGNSHVSRRDE